VREGRNGAAWLAGSNLAVVYCMFPQALTRDATNGWNPRRGDLLVGGTVSGPTETERGCPLVLTRGDTEPTVMPGGETREFLKDADQGAFHDFCDRSSMRGWAFGACAAVS